MKKIIIWILITLLVILTGSAVYTYKQIYKQVKTITVKAMAEFSGDAIEALGSLIQSDQYNYEEKNTAIWALGQFADPEAISFLEQLSSETEDDSLPFDRSSGLSKYEIEKAIKWCRNGNLTSWMYKKLKD